MHKFHGRLGGPHQFLNVTYNSMSCNPCSLHSTQQPHAANILIQPQTKRMRISALANKSQPADRSGTTGAHEQLAGKGKTTCLKWRTLCEVSGHSKHWRPDSLCCTEVQPSVCQAPLHYHTAGVALLKNHVAACRSNKPQITRGRYRPFRAAPLSQPAATIHPACCTWLPLCFSSHQRSVAAGNCWMIASCSRKMALATGAMSTAHKASTTSAASNTAALQASSPLYEPCFGAWRCKGSFKGARTCCSSQPSLQGEAS
jgi:hypothetical protein